MSAKVKIIACVNHWMWPDSSSVLDLRINTKLDTNKRVKKQKSKLVVGKKQIYQLVWQKAFHAEMKIMKRFLPRKKRITLAIAEKQAKTKCSVHKHIRIICICTQRIAPYHRMYILLHTFDRNFIRCSMFSALATPRTANKMSLFYFTFFALSQQMVNNVAQ